MSDREYLLKQPPLRAILTFAVPIMLGNLFQQLYTMADSVIVGRFVGESALAAVGASYSLTSVFIAVAIGGGIGASVTASRAFGARDYRTMKESISTSLISFLVLSIILGTIGLLFCREIMTLLNTPDEILPDAALYLGIYFLGLPFLFMYNILSSMFNALGKSRIPLCLLIFSSILNIILDILTVTKLGMGVAGVAWATLVSQGISAVISFSVLLWTLRNFEGRCEKLWDKALFGKIITISLPSILQQSTVSIGMMLVQSVVNSFGAEMLAGFSSAMRIESLVVVPMAAMGNAMSSYTAQNMGAEKTERVVRGYRVSYGIIFTAAIAICLLLELAPETLITMFLGTEGTEAAMSTGIGYLSFMGWFYALIGLKMITDGVLRGAGDMRIFTFANMVNLSIRVLVAFIFAPRIGIQMVWMAVPIGWAANYLISLWGYIRGSWKRK